MKVFTNSTYFAIFWPNKGWILPLFLFTLLIWDTSQFCHNLRANRPHRTLVSPNQTYSKQNYLTLYVQRRANLPTYWKFTILFIIFKNNSRLQCFSWRVFQGCCVTESLLLHVTHRSYPSKRRACSKKS